MFFELFVSSRCAFDCFFACKGSNFFVMLYKIYCFFNVNVYDIHYFIITQIFIKSSKNTAGHGAVTGHRQRIISILKNRKTRDVKTTVMAEAEKSLVWWVAKKNKSKAEMN